MMESIYIIGIIALLLIMLVFILRDRLTSFFAGGEFKRGNTSAKGQVGMSAEPPDSNSKSSKVNPNSVDITGNFKILGINILRIVRSGVRFARNFTLLGKTTVTIRNQPELEDSPLQRLPKSDHDARQLPESEQE